MPRKPHWTEIHSVPRVCVNCGAEFLATPNAARTTGAPFCSRACVGKYRGRTMDHRGEKNPAWRGGMSPAKRRPLPDPQAEADLRAKLRLRRKQDEPRADMSEYHTWVGMRSRCRHPGNHNYPRYGGRGIRVCDRWNASFEAFLKDMGPRPAPGYSLDRIDNDGNYEPGNCRWAPPKIQGRNRSDNRPLADAPSISAAAESNGLTDSALRRRLERGWSEDRALKTPLRPHARHVQPVTTQEAPR